MQEHGRIIAILQPQTGTSPRTGQPWYSQSYVMEIDGRYTRRVAFSLWGYENNAKAQLQLGEYITMSGEVEAHEHQGRWYNELRAYDIEKRGQSVLRENYSQPSQPSSQPACPHPAQPAVYPQAAGVMPATPPASGSYAPQPQVPPVAYPPNDYPTTPAPGNSGVAPY